MVRFLIDVVIFGAITQLAVIPICKVSLGRGRRKSPRKWRRAAAICAVAVAALGWSSRSLTADCLAERNEGCVDMGGVGFQVLFLGGFTVYALMMAYLVYNE